MTKPKVPFDQASMEDVEDTSNQILELIESRFALSSEHRADLGSGFPRGAYTESLKRKDSVLYRVFLSFKQTVL